MNTQPHPDSTLRPLVTDAPDPGDKQFRAALQSLHDRNAKLLAIEAFIMRHLPELSGTHWSVTSSIGEINGLAFYCNHPGETLYSPEAPTPEDIARRFPDEWQIKESYEGRKNAEAVRDGVLLCICPFLPPPKPRSANNGQTLTF